MDYSSVTYGTDQVSNAALAGIGIGYLIVCLIVGIVSLVAMWKIFTKAGRPGWQCIIPIYNTYVMFEIAGMSGWMFLLLCIPVVNIVISIMLMINLAKAFGKSSGFAVGLIFLPFIFTLILAFGKSEYTLAKPQQ